MKQSIEKKSAFDLRRLSKTRSLKVGVRKSYLFWGSVFWLLGSIGLVFGTSSTGREMLAFHTFFPMWEIAAEPQVEPPVDPPSSDPPYESIFMPQLLWLGTEAGNGIGYSSGYGEFGFLLAGAARPKRIMPMVQASGEVFYNGDFAASAGLIGRYLKPEKCRLIGGNVFYDYAQGLHGGFHQVGLGAEVLGNRWDFRANGFLAVGQHKKFSTCVFDQYLGGYVMTLRQTTSSFQGVNAEVGCHTLGSTRLFQLYVAARPYYIWGSFCQSAPGIQLRVRPQIRDYLFLDLSTSYDRLFRWTYQGRLVLTIPLYALTTAKAARNRQCMPDRLIYQPVERFNIIPLINNCCWSTNF